jgi:hypothetical protein
MYKQATPLLSHPSPSIEGPTLMHAGPPAMPSHGRSHDQSCIHIIVNLVSLLPHVAATIFLCITHSSWYTLYIVLTAFCTFSFPQTLSILQLFFCHFEQPPPLKGWGLWKDVLPILHLHVKQIKAYHICPNLTRSPHLILAVILKTYRRNRHSGRKTVRINAPKAEVRHRISGQVLFTFQPRYHSVSYLF